MSEPANAPGLKKRHRGDVIDYYWVAGQVVRDTGTYPVKTVRLFFDTDEERAARCRVLTAELREWLATGGEQSTEFAGTLSSLIERYRRDEDSPYHAVKYNTRAHYDDCLDLLQGGFGARKIVGLTGQDFRRWYKALREPAKKDGPERIRRAHNCMKLVRILISYGTSCGYRGCAAVAAMLAEMEFEVPAPRKVAMTFEQASGIVDKALAMGRPSIALAQALQFECGLRQKDVIGEWVKGGLGGIPSQGRRWQSDKRWTGGVAWSDIDGDLVLRKTTTKTKTVGEWSLALFPLVMRTLAAFDPIAGRTGPLILDEGSGQPYTYRNFWTYWRKASDAAGVPRGVWNMDSRAGSLTEGDEAGAEIHDLQQHATHSDAKTTGRYIRRRLASTSRVAELRVLKRGKE